MSRASALLLLLPLLLASRAHAQEAPGAAPSTTEAGQTAAPADATNAAESAPAAHDEAPANDDLGGLSSLLGESVVTTASRSAERASSAPAAIFTITAAELRTYGIRSVDEALVFLGVGVQTSRVRDYPSGGDVGAQGVLLRDSGRHVLVLLDGNVMNSQDTGGVPVHEGLGVPLEAIDHLEVVLGAGSVMYGSNAMLAVINIFTRHAADDPGVHATAELGVMPPSGESGRIRLPTEAGDRFGLRYRLGLGFAREFQLAGSDAELTVRAEWLEELSNSYRTVLQTSETFQIEPGESTWGGVTHHTMQAPSVVAALRVGQFKLQLQASHYERGMPLVAIFDDPTAGEQRSYLRADLRHSALLDPHASLLTRLYAGLSDWSEATTWSSPFWCLPGQIDGCSFVSRSRGRSAGLEQQLTVDWSLDGALVTTIGYDIRGRDATSRPADYFDRVTGALPAATRLPFTHTVSALGAVYAQQVWQPLEWLALNAGARLDVDSLFGARVSPRLAATLLPAEGSSIRASYAEAFRAPTAYELNEVDPTYRVKALGLEPEVARTVELEWQQRVEWVSFSLRGFASFYEGFIDTQLATPEEVEAGLANGDLASSADADYILRWVNLSALRSYGGSLSFTLRPAEGLVIGGSFNVADTRMDGARLPLVPLWLGNARVAYTFVPDGATLALVSSFSGHRLAYADFSTLTPHEASEQLELRLTFTSPFPGVKGLCLRAAISYSVNPFLPNLLGAPNPDVETEILAYVPTPSPLVGFLGLQYDLDP